MCALARRQDPRQTVDGRLDELEEMAAWVPMGVLPQSRHKAISRTTWPGSISQATRKVDSAAADTGIPFLLSRTRSRARSATNLTGRQRPRAIARRAADRTSFETCFISRASSNGKNSMQRARTSRGKTRSAGLLVCERKRGIFCGNFHATRRDRSACATPARRARLEQALVAAYGAPNMGEQRT